MSSFNDEFRVSAEPPPPPGPSGLGGWLILVAIGLVLSSLRLSAFLMTAFVPIFTDGTWEVLTTPGTEAYHPLWGPLLLFELSGNAGYVVAQIWALALFFQRSRSFPRLYIAIALSNLPFIIFDAWLMSFVLPEEPIFDPETMQEVGRSLVGVFVWAPYMMLSKRVKNTFVE